MSKTDTMAKLPGLFQRAGAWTLRVMLPLDLQGAYQGRPKVLESLHTTDNAEAKLKGTARRAEWLATFANKRRELNPQLLGAVTPELPTALAQRVAAAVLRTDDNVRGNPATAQLFVDTLRPFRTPAGLTIPTEAPSPTARRAAPPASPLQGLSSELSAELSAINADMGVHGATQRIASVLPLVKAEARALGMEFDERAPGALDALRESLKAYRKALHDISKRDHGEVIDTPPVHSRMAPTRAKLDKLRDVLPQWKASKARKPQTVQAAEKALALYEQCTGNPPIASLTRTQGVDMRAFLLAGGVTAKTARDRFDHIKGFLNFASRELELLPRNPWAGLAIEYTTTTPRRPWSSEQLAAYFSRPLHVAYDLPSTWEAGADAAYWVPLLGIFTGARIGELCQLRTADVSTVDGVHVLYITNESEGQNVKTVAARRVVPIYTELVRLGFMDFVDAIRAAGSVQLFPALPLHKSKAGQYFSEWFGTARMQEGGSRFPDFHSLRHTVRSKLASAGIAEPLIDTLVGHEVSGSTGARRYTMRTTEDLHRALCAVRSAQCAVAYPGLHLPRVFVKPMVSATKRKRAGKSGAHVEKR